MQLLNIKAKAPSSPSPLCQKPDSLLKEDKHLLIKYRLHVLSNDILRSSNSKSVGAQHAAVTHPLGSTRGNAVG